MAVSKPFFFVGTYSTAVCLKSIIIFIGLGITNQNSSSQLKHRKSGFSGTTLFKLIGWYKIRIPSINSLWKSISTCVNFGQIDLETLFGTLQGYVNRFIWLKKAFTRV